MKRRLAALLLALTLGAPLVAPAAGVTVQAETAEETVTEDNQEEEPTTEEPAEEDTPAEEPAAEEPTEEDVQEEESAIEESETEESTTEDVLAEEPAAEDVEVQVEDDDSKAADNSTELTDDEKKRIDELKIDLYYEFKSQLQDVIDCKSTHTEFQTPLSQEDAELLNKLYYLDGEDRKSAAYLEFEDAIVNRAYFEMPEGFYWWQHIYNSFPLTSVPTFEVDIKVARDYSASGESNTYELDADKAKAARTAIENGRAIAREANDMSLYQALCYFKQKICSLVDYWDDHDKDIAAPYGIINVFDLDPDTKVVCEGYSKAFLFLFNEWAKNNEAKADKASCIIVDGVTVGGVTDGGHEWNHVFVNGYNYVIDVTNCDGDGVGYPDKLFLKNVISHTTETYKGEERCVGYTLDCGDPDDPMIYSYYSDTHAAVKESPIMDYYPNYRLDINENDYQDPTTWE